MLSLYEDIILSKKPIINEVVRPFVFTKDPLIMNLLQSFAKRSEQGIEEYKGTMGTAQKPLEDWITDVQEEMYDACVYLEKVKTLIKTLNIKK